MFSTRANWPLSRNPFTLALDELRAARTPFLDLTASNPTKCGFHYDASAILSAFQNASALAYDPQPKGMLNARREVARYYLDDHQTTVDPESLFLTTSTSEAYTYVFRLLCNAGDELLLPKPSYPLFEFLADLQDVRLVPYSLAYAHGWFFDFPSLEKAVTTRTRGVVIVHPNNPTGSYVHTGEQGALNEFCRARGLALIVDEVFLDYGLEGSGAEAHLSEERDRSAENVAPPKSRACDQGEAFFAHRADGESVSDARSLRSTGRPKVVPTRAIPHPSFASNREVLTFTLSGLSKISALPQMKVAWVVTSGPDEIASAAMA